MAESGCLKNINVSNIEVSQDVRIEGDLRVNGTTFSIQTNNTVIKDTVIELNNGTSDENNANDIGIVMTRGTDVDEHNAFMGWDESENQFIVGTTQNTASDTGNFTVAEGTLRVDTLTGPTDATLSVSAAGTGALNIWFGGEKQTTVKGS